MSWPCAIFGSAVVAALATTLIFAPATVLAPLGFLAFVAIMMFILALAG